jgi:hypothetical protein
MSDDCKAAAQDNLIGAISTCLPPPRVSRADPPVVLAVGALILLGFLVLILKWFYVKFRSRHAPPRAATPAEKP